MSKSIKKNFLYNFLNNLSTVLFPLITVPYVARVLDPEGVGLFNFSNTYAGYFALCALLGIPTYGVREVPKLRGDIVKLTEFVSKMMSISLITTIGVSLIYFITISIIDQINENYILFLVAGFALYFAPFKTDWYYKGLEEFGYITFRSLIIRFFSIICLFLFVHDKSDIVIYILINVLGSSIADIWNFIKMFMSGVHPYFTMKGLSPHIKPLLVLLASTVAISVYTVLDTLMLGFMKDYSEVGFYNNASSMSKIFLMIVTSLSAVSIPRFSFFVNNNEIDNANTLFNKSFSFVFFLALPISIGVMCVAPIFVPWFLGGKFVGSIVPLMILAFLIIAIGVSNLAGFQVLIGMGLETLFLRSLLVGTFSNFILNVILIPSYGAIGASIASVIAEFSISGAMMFYIYRYTPLRVSVWNDIIKSLFGAILFFPIAWLLPKGIFVITYLIVFVLISSVIYMLSQKLLQNSTFTMFQETIVSFIKNKR